MDNFRFTQLNGKKIELYNFKKPVYLITNASWCVTSKGEIPAINLLAEKYSGRIGFVIIFWDNEVTTKKMARYYSKHITALYVNELSNRDSYVISKLKHSLGLPTIFLIDGNKKILDIRRGVTHSFNINFQESFDLNYKKIYDGIARHLLRGSGFRNETQTASLKTLRIYTPII